ncbi:MAG: ATP-binding protein [Aquabacterium sp.]
MSWIQQISSVLLRLFSSATLDTRVQTAAPEIQAEIDRARERASYEMMPAAMIGQLVASQGIYWILQDRLPGTQLLWWLVLRQLISAVRLAHASFVLHGYLPMGRTTMRLFTAMAFCDGMAWGALGWWLTPIFRLDVAVVTISTLVGVAALAALMLQTNMPTAIVFILPMTLPNAVYAAGRGDDLGYFCMIAISGLALMMLAEVGRSSRRIIEMLRLRFESEQASKAKTEALKQARVLAETRSRFLATMSHEMRTPLHGILGLLRLVQDDVRAMDNPRLMRNLTLIQGSGEHLVHVINDVLDFSKSEAGGLSVHEQPFCVHEILSELAETSQMHCADKGLTLDVRLQIDPHDKVVGDPVRLRQVLLNLLGNAIKFTPRGSVGLHVWRDERSGAMVFQVCDTGIGIAAPEVPRVFDAFHQAEGTYERRFGGTGLGLTISRDLCKAMGGSLRCESELGKGSVFTCELPLVRRQRGPEGVAGRGGGDAAGCLARDGAGLVEGGASRGGDGIGPAVRPARAAGGRQPRQCAGGAGRAGSAGRAGDRGGQRLCRHRMPGTARGRPGADGLRDARDGWHRDHPPHPRARTSARQPADRHRGLDGQRGGSV